MDYCILDLEWNQSEKAKQNSELPFEIVEIGAIKLDSDKNYVEKYNELIKPRVYTKLHYMTKKIIHLEIEDLQKGRDFEEAVRDFLLWCGEDYVFCTWGTLDLTELQRNMRFYGMEELSGGPLLYYDVQKFFSILFEDGKKRRSLEYAVDYLGIEKDIPFHRALSDAYYTAKVLKAMGRPEVEENFSFDVYVPPKSKGEEIHVTFDTYSKYISRKFRDKTEAMADREVVSTRCYVCGKTARKKVRWYSVNGKNYYCLAWCGKHGFLKGKIRMKRAADDGVYVVKTLKLVDREAAENIKEKQEKLKRQRRDRRRAGKKK